MDVIIADVIGDIVLIFVLSSFLGALARRCGQPGVVGQILTGVVLGPTLLGRLPGHLVNHLFPHQLLPFLAVLAQVAVVIFMFAVGYEINFKLLRGQHRAVPMIAACALVIPMAMGAGSVGLFGPLYASAGQHNRSGHSFVLFMAVAMSITALPVLAAIVRERGIAQSTPGVIATAAAGVMDVAAWLVLAAALIGTRHAAGRPLPVTLLLVACFVAGMLLVVRPALRWWFGRPGSLLTHQMPIAMALAMGSAWITASIGLHAVFGGFFAGLVMPRRDGVPDPDVLRSTEAAGGLLLPLFFVITGLSLNIGAVHGSALILLVALFLIASAGKLGPAYLASRLTGLRARQSAVVAALLNTRGLTELIALNIGLETGLINQTLFTVLVIVALATTAMTGPLLSLIGRTKTTPPSGRETVREEQLAADPAEA
jgi:Kef-type K+ transport system membrane component KefB